MISGILDTNILIQMFRKHLPAIEWVSGKAESCGGIGHMAGIHGRG
jgi:hypothetical protein